jgi:hypothetical protein
VDTRRTARANYLDGVPLWRPSRLVSLRGLLQLLGLVRHLRSGLAPCQERDAPLNKSKFPGGGLIRAGPLHEVVGKPGSLRG